LHFLKFEMNLTFITRILLHASDDLHTYLHSIIERHEEIGKIENFILQKQEDEQHEEWNQ
jgi:hypothetical protein